MNGQHDQGGMQSYGPIPRPQDEPVFHADWEGRVEAMTMALLMGGHFGSGGALRYAIESLPPLRYLQDHYFERHLDGIVAALLHRGLIEAAEISNQAEHLADGGSPDSVGAPSPSAPSGEPANRRTADRSPRFAVGDAVMARNIHPRGHTRLARYVRGHRGKIVRIHPAAVFPDTDAHDMGENPQHVYSVSFDGYELWGDTAEPNLKVQLGLWESYLEAA